MHQKIHKWAEGIEQLAGAARAYPQVAYSSFINSLSREWSYLRRVIEGCDNEYFKLRDTIKQVSPQQCWEEVLEREHTIFELRVSPHRLCEFCAICLFYIR